MYYRFFITILWMSVAFSMNLPEKVIVYHDIGRNGTIESVKKHGLYSLSELFKRGLTTDNPSNLRRGLLADQYHVIYFRPLLKEPTDKSKLVGYKVDPHATYVHNMEYRFDANLGKYNASKILLSTYLKNLQKAEQMCKAAPPGIVVIFNPFTSVPFYVNATDVRYYDSREHLGILSHQTESARHYLYLGEVTIQKEHIKPEELVFFDQRLKAKL